MKKIHTSNAPEPAGHYSQAIIHNNVVYVSGQLPVDPVTGTKLTGEIQLQAHQVLKNLESILEEADSGMKQLLKVTIYVTDIKNWDVVNQIYKEYVGDHKPARVVIPTKELHHGFKIEIDAIAAVEI